MTAARIEDVSALAQAFGADMGEVKPNVRKINTTATRAPLPSDDETQGWETGSRWQWQGQEWLRTEAGWLAKDEAVTPEMFGARGGGADDRTALVAAISAPQPLSAQGTYLVSALGAPSKTLSGRAKLLRSAAGNLMTGSASGLEVKGWTFDLNRPALGDVSGHGLSLRGNDITIRDVTVSGFGSSGTGGGTGVLIYGDSEANKALHARLDGLKLIADPTAAQSFGWILANVDYSFVSRVYAQDVRGPGTSYAHELKNNAQFNSLSQLIAKSSQVALAYGQDTPGVDGSDYNVATNIVSDACDTGILLGEAFGNVISGAVHNGDGAPGTQKYGLILSGGSGVNVVTDFSTFGPLTASVRLEGPRNAIQIAAYDTAANIVEFRAGSERNFVEVLHPGARLSIEGAYSDSVGNGLKSNVANVIHSPVTGEWFGSISGSFKWKLGASGATFFSSQRFRFEDDTTVSVVGATPTGQSLIFAHNTPARQQSGALTHTSNATAANEFWDMRTGGASVMRWYSTVMRAVADAAYDLGNAAFRFRDTFSLRFRPGTGAAIWTSGTGSPEGALDAPPGSLYTRDDGGAGATLYVKESGSGNTGWVAK